MKRHEFITKDIYKTIKDNNYWYNCLKNISYYCTESSYGGAAIIPMDADMQNWRYGSNENTETENLYYNYWKNKSPLSENYSKIDLTSGFIYKDDQFLSENEIDHIPFYQDFLRVFGVRRIHNVLFKTDVGHRFILSVQSPIGMDNKDSEKIKQNMIKVTPHIINSVELSINFNRKSKSIRIFENLFEEIPYGVAILNENNTVIHANRILLNMENDGIFIKDGKIRTKYNSYNKNIEKIISQNSSINKVFKIYCESGKILYGKIIILEKDLDTSTNGSTKMIVFSIQNVGLKTEAVLRDLFLTKSQAKIACLIANGKSVKDSALEMKISEGTARQMVKEIFSRIGINSQSQLTAFVKNISLIS
ncbi:transcriptional regulator LuxR [Gluconobacter frateurii M-2]|nr:transcriptional regulator LuxR [Gluconobacter frateurii M-2]